MSRLTHAAQGNSRKVLLLLFGIALAIRLILAVDQAVYGLNGIPWLALSAWGDFNAVYLPWLSLLQHGFLPYRDFYTYKYTPLFLYVLYPFYWIAPRLASVPIVLADAGTAVCVYLIARTVAGPRIALAVGLLYTLSPFVLYYEDFLWLSSQPMTFFIVLAVYLLSSDRPLLSSAALAVAVMFKQEALFILPAYLILFVRSFGRRTVRGIAVFAAVALVVSLPFLVLAPKDYLLVLSYYPVYGTIPASQLEPGIVGALTTGALSGAGSYTAQACGMQTIPGLYMGTICGSIINTQQFASSLLLGRLNQVAFVLSPVLLLLLAPALYSVRRAPNFAQMLCTYSMLCGFAAFSAFVEPSLAYYFIPVYALMFGAIVDRRALVLVTTVSLLILFVPEGPFQIILPVGYLFGLVILQDSSRTMSGS